MATPDEEERMHVDGEEKDALSSDASDSENDLSGDEESPPAVEWLATGREKRSTAGNRMKSMIAAEEPDDELELLFAEDADDVGFTDVEDDGSDAHMSSSEDEDAPENADELEGEKELEKQARESRQAARKRKAQEAIPVKFRKKVKIDTSQTPSASVTPAPKPRPKKKSERISWLPSPADMPTRASRRETTMAGKEQLHKQMAEREEKRLKQIEAMERKAKKMEALKKPPMTQAERLAEAALVEKRNAKSLNRWEEAEKQREEERKAKLAALNNRTLEGPVVTFWSGVGEWIGGKLKHVGKIVTIEEKPAKKKRHSAVGSEARAESPHEDKVGQVNIRISPDEVAAVNPDPALSKGPRAKPEPAKEPVVPSGVGAGDMGNENALSSVGITHETQVPHHAAVESTSAVLPDSPAVLTAQDGEPLSALSSRGRDSIPLENTSQTQIPPPADIRPPDLRPPDLQPPSANLYTTSLFAPPAQSSLMMPSELKPPSNSFLAPPMGVSQNGLSVPMIGYHSSPSSTNSSNVLAPPNPAQRQSPLSMPRTNIHPPPPPTPTPTPTRPTQVIPTPKSKPLSTPSTPSTTPVLSHVRPPSKMPSSALKSTKANAPKHQLKESVLPPPPSPPANGKATRNCIILQNFNENAIKDKSIQTRILFNREMNKLPKQGPAVRCVITNHPARYRDPKTGLPYYNAYAFKQIRKLYSGEYKWSNLIGAWIGTGTSAAIGVPARFRDPNAPGLPKEQALPDPSPNDDKVNEGSNEDTGSQIADKQPAPIPVLSAPQSSHISTPATASQTNNKTPATASRPSIESGKTEALHIASGPNHSSQPYIPTTEATFALNPDYVTTSDTPMAGNSELKTVNNIGNTRPTEVVSTSSDLSGPPASIVGASVVSSSLDTPVAVKQEAGNQ
ncbi:YL1 nuclear protein-domain-containing protein [Nemania abortiva]|nr:YL1 nuclear protein-domain-containing protein [Nemania abortiva]